MKKSKILAILLAVMLTLSSFSCLSVVSFAAVIAEDGEFDELGVMIKKHWDLDDSGKLTVYADVEVPTWTAYVNDIKEVVFVNPVKFVEPYLFSGYPQLAKVTFECEGPAIGKYAFQNCDSLKEIVISGGSVSDYAFYDCDALETVVLKKGVEISGKNIFKSCDSIKTVEVENGITLIGEGMFEDCVAIETIALPDSIETIGRLAFENCAALENIIIPDSVVSLGEYAFYDCVSAKTAYIGHNVSSIGEYAFGRCTSLESVEVKCAMPAISEGMFYGCSSLKGLADLPDGIKEIGRNAFKDCSAFAEINIPSSVTTIGDSAFDGTALVTVVIPVGVEVIGAGVFTNCNKLEAINVAPKNRFYASKDGVLYTASFAELICCPAAKSGEVVVNDGTVAIRDDAFIGCTSIDSIVIPNSVEDIATNAFNGCSDALVIKANCDSYAAQYAKYYAMNLEVTHSTISDWIVTVEPDCDDPGVKEKQCVACGNVEETGVIDPIGHKYDNGVVTKEADCDEDGIVKFTCQNAGCDANYTEVIPATGHNYDNGTVTIEPTCDTDGVKVFRCKNDGCYDYYNVTLPATGHNLDDGTVKVEATCTTDGEKVYKCKDETCSYEVKEVIPAFGHKYDDGVVTLEPLCEADGEKTYTCQNGCGYVYTEVIPATDHKYDKGVITKYPTVKVDGEITFTCQNTWCTEDHANHTYIVYIPNVAFDGILATNDGAYADEDGNIQNLAWLITDTYDLYIYEDDTADQWAAYRDSIKTVTFTKNATTVENGSFAYMNALTEANILFSLGKIEAYAFQYCENLKTVRTGSFSEIEEFAFYHCTSLESVDIYGGLPEGSIGRNVFLDCSNLSEVVLRNGVLSLGEAMFKGCSALDEIIIPESLLAIGDSAFDGTAIKEIRIPTDVKVIEKGAFTNCFALEAINVDSKNDNYFSVDGVLYDMAIAELLLCPAAKTGEVNVWEGTASIAADAFIGCKNITKVTIPNSVTTIADNAFNGCAEDLVIVCNCDSTAAAFAKGRGIATEMTHVAADTWQITSEADCINDGTKERVCTGCGYSYETVTILALGHNYDAGVVTTAATCEADGVKTFTCTRSGCDDTYAEAIPALGHDYEGKVTVEPTCEADGVETFTCKNGCGSEYTEVIPGYTHNYIATVVKPGTCITMGVTEYKCENCGDSYTVKEYGEHKLYSEPVRIEATCNAEGKEGFMCSLCKEFVGEVTVLPATSHTESKWIVDKKATCTAAGSKYKECTDCGTVLATEEIAALGHSAGDWKIDKNATANAEGKKHIDCTVCGETLETAAIAQLKCSKPEVEKVSNISKGVKVSWSSVSGADYYRVYRKTKNGEWKYLDSTKKTNFTDDTAKSGTKYYYSVRAINEAGISARSNALSRYYLEDPNLKSATSTKSGITLKWSKVAGAEGYIVYRKTGSGSYERIKLENGVSNTSYTDKTAKKGKKYTYKVKAFYSKTSSDYSRTRVVTDKY